MKAVGVTIGPETYLDHLGVLCELLEIPLLVTDDKLLRTARDFYPGLHCEERSFKDVSSEILMDEFDCLIYPSRGWAFESYVFAKEIYHSDVRIVYCPHGNSDKGHSFDYKSKYPVNDIELYYGQHMHDLLKETRRLETINSLVHVGNFRLSYYKQKRQHLDRLAEKHIFSRFKEKRETILYAPTWNTDECPTSFFHSCLSLMEELPEKYNLIVKLHPFLERDFPALTYRLLGQYDNHSRILFVDDFPPIYPILSRCAFYLGDFSSIGYDFLAFDRPLFFFDPFNTTSKTRSHYLHQCGMTIPADTKIFSFIEERLDENKKAFSSVRKKMYSYTFGKPKSRVKGLWYLFTGS